MRVLLILGHPRADSLGGALAEAYAAGARRAGCEVRVERVGELAFDPDVTQPSPRDQPLEPDLERVRAHLAWAEHVVLVYPTWWGTYPARLKGLLDRLLLPGFAFHHRGGGQYQPLLSGRTAELITTMDTPPWVYRWIYRAPGSRALGDATLGFCGLRVVRRSLFGPVVTSHEVQRRRWLARVERLGERLGQGAETPAQRLGQRLRSWLAALRLQFYPMTWMAYSLGALAAPGAPAGGPFWAGLVALFLLEAATVFCNDYWDYESDRRNEHWGPFNGGSRVLVDGRISRPGLAQAAGWMLAGFLPLAAALAVGAGGGSAVLLGLLGALALGYTVPPLKLCYRTLGELDVALTHSLGVVLVGYVLQGGAWNASLPWLVSLPLFLSVLPAIILSGIPDQVADRAVGKRTVAVRFGQATALRIAAGTALAAGVAGLVLHLLGQEAGMMPGLYGPAAALAALHGVWLATRLEHYRRARRPPGRVDGLMVLALTFNLWFVVMPLTALLRGL